MARLPAASPSTGHDRVKKIFDLAHRLQRVLQDRLEVTKSIAANLEACLGTDLPLVTSLAKDDYRRRAEEFGCHLWNAAIRINHAIEAEAQHATASTFAAHLRSFAFMLLHLGRHTRSNTPELWEKTQQNLKIGLKAAQYALLSKQPDVGLRVLEICSAYLDRPEETESVFRPDLGKDDYYQEQKRLLVAYLHLRIQHARSIGHWDMAEHFFIKAKAQDIDLTPEMLGQTCQLYHACATDLLGAAQHTQATKWLHRVLDALDHASISDSALFAEVRIGATTQLVKLLLQAGDEKSKSTAWSLASELDSLHELGDDIDVIGAQVKVLLAIEPLRRDLLKQTMTRLACRSMSEQTFRSAMRLIHKVRSRDRACAVFCIRTMIIKSIMVSMQVDGLTDSSRQWLENSLVTLVLFLVDKQDNDAQVASSTELQQMLEVIAAEHSIALSQKAVHAIQTLIWKAMNSSERQTAAAWLVTIQHPLLNTADGANRACIQRKAVQLMLELDRPMDARSAFFEMSEQTQQEPLSSFLAFRTALVQHDHEWATKCLSAIIKSAGRGSQLLYACALQAQSSSSRALTITALQAIVSTMPDADLSPVLLRCLVRLQLGEVAHSTSDTTEEVLAILLLTERFARAAELESFSDTTELQWWARTAYNLALQRCDAGDADVVIRSLQVSARLSVLPVAGESPSDRQERTDRLLVSHFLISSALIVRARGAPNGSEVALQSYSEARSHIKAYLHSWQPQAANNTSPHLATQRAFELHRFDLEAICKMKQWQELSAALDRSLQFPNLPHWQKLADIVLIIHRELGTISEAEQSSHTPKILDILQHIVNDTWRRDKDVKQAAQWVRLALSIDMAAMAKGKSDGQVAFKLMDQAAGIAKRGRQGGTATYPHDELQWLASIAFNQAIDACIAVQREVAWKWFDAALELAHHMNDNGALHALLKSRQAEAEQFMSNRRA